MALYAVLKTLLYSRSAEVTDISATGAKLRGDNLPAAGADLFVRIEGVETFATVVWSHEGECGLSFEEPLDRAMLASLQMEARRTQLMRLTPEQKQAWEMWAVASSR